MRVGCWINSYEKLRIVRQRSCALPGGEELLRNVLVPGAWSLRDLRTLANVVRLTGRKTVTSTCRKR